MNELRNYVKKTYIVSKFTFVEVIKSKILFNVVVLGFALLTVCYLAFSFTHGVPVRAALDFGLGCLSVSSVGIAIFMGAGLLSLEIENRTLYMILVRPIKRSSFLLGRIAGMSGILVLNVLILAVMTTGLYLFLGGEIQPLLYWVVAFSLIEAIICLLLVILFSLMTNRILAVIHTITVFIIGHAINETLMLGIVQNKGWLKVLIQIYSYVFPNFSKLNLKDYVLYHPYLPHSLLFGILAYGLTYIFMLALLTGLIFEKKGLD